MKFTNELNKVICSQTDQMKNVCDDLTLGNYHKLMISTSRLEMETFQIERPLESQTMHENIH